MTPQIWIAIVILIAMGICIVGCSTSAVMTTFELVVSAAEAALPVIGAAVGLPPATAAMIETYLEAVSAASSQASTILASTATSAEKTAEIIAAFAKITSGLILPAGTPAEVLSVVNAVAQAVVNFLANFSTSAAAPSFKISSADRIKLANLKTRSDVVSGKLKGMKK